MFFHEEKLICQLHYHKKEGKKIEGREEAGKKSSQREKKLSGKYPRTLAPRKGEILVARPARLSLQNCSKIAPLSPSHSFVISDPK